jgi:hypothetical protein
LTFDLFDLKVKEYQHNSKIPLKLVLPEVEGQSFDKYSSKDIHYELFGACNLHEMSHYSAVVKRSGDGEKWTQYIKD